jgi:hypothetical protein
MKSSSWNCSLTIWRHSAADPSLANLSEGLIASVTKISVHHSEATVDMPTPGTLPLGHRIDIVAIVKRRRPPLRGGYPANTNHATTTEKIK